MLCPCCSQLPFSQCCQPLLSGEKAAASPEALMRSRYSAYHQRAIDYIYDTYAVTARAQQSKQSIAEWAGAVIFIRLEIVAAPVDDGRQGFVEFIAHYLQHKVHHRLHEKSRFVNESESESESGRWRYIDGIIIPEQERVIGRNDPCPCQSGNKFKKCHG